MQIRRFPRATLCGPPARRALMLTSPAVAIWIAAVAATLQQALGSSNSSCPPAAAACATDPKCAAFGVLHNTFVLHGCANDAALVPNDDWEIFVPTSAAKVAWKPLGRKVNVDEAKCAAHPTTPRSSLCGSPPPLPPAPPPCALSRSEPSCNSTAGCFWDGRHGGVCKTRVLAQVDVFVGHTKATWGTEYFCFRGSPASDLSGTLVVFVESRIGNCGDQASKDVTMKRSTDAGRSLGPLEL